MKRPLLQYWITPGFLREIWCQNGKGHNSHATKIPQLQTTATVYDTADAKSNTSEGKHGEIFFG